MYAISLKYLIGLNFIKTKYQKIKNKLEILGKLRKNKIKISGNNNILYIGKNSLLRDSNIFIKGNNNIIYIGDDCVVNNTSIILDNEGSEIRIGNKTSIAKVQIVSLEPYKIEIGEDCMLSYDIEIRNTDSHKIGDNSIVAAGSIVTKDVKANTIVSGNPAKQIKENVYWTREEVMQYQKLGDMSLDV